MSLAYTAPSRSPTPCSARTTSSLSSSRRVPLLLVSSLFFAAGAAVRTPCRAVPRRACVHVLTIYV